MNIGAASAAAAAPAVFRNFRREVLPDCLADREFVVMRSVFPKRVWYSIKLKLNVAVQSCLNTQRLKQERASLPDQQAGSPSPGGEGRGEGEL